MATREEKRRAFLIVMNGFMAKYAEEIESAGMSDERLSECIAGMMQFRVIWGGLNRFSGRCKPEGLRIWAGPTPLEEYPAPVLAGRELLEMARAEYGIPEPNAVQLALF